MKTLIGVPDDPIKELLKEADTSVKKDASLIAVDDINEEVLSASCGDCKHYYVTWDKDFPYGCKAMGFKSRTYPALGGQECRPEWTVSFLKEKVQGRIEEATSPSGNPLCQPKKTLVIRQA